MRKLWIAVLSCLLVLTLVAAATTLAGCKKDDTVVTPSGSEQNTDGGQADGNTAVESNAVETYVEAEPAP